MGLACDGQTAATVALLTNRALAHLKLGSWSACCADASAALELDPGNGKALLRRGQVRLPLARKI